MVIKNGKLKWTIISVSFAVFLGISNLLTGFYTNRINKAKIEQKFMDNLETQGNLLTQTQYEISELEQNGKRQNKEIIRIDKTQTGLLKDVDYIKSDVREIKSDVKIILEKVK